MRFVISEHIFQFLFFKSRIFRQFLMVFVLIIVNYSYSQENHLEVQKHKVHLVFADKSETYLNSNPDSAFFYAEKQREICSENQDTLGMTISYGLMGESSIKRGDSHGAMKYFYQMLKLARSTNQTDLTAKALNYIGVVQTIYDNYDDAIKSFTEAIAIYEKLDDSRKLIGAINNLGIVYKNNEEYDKALNHFERFLNKNLESKDSIGIAVAYSNIGEVYQLKGEINKAKDYFFECLKYDEASNNRIGQSNTLNKIASLYLAESNLIEAEKLANKALNIGIEAGVLEEVSTASYTLYEIYSTKHQYQKALDMYKVYSESTDSITNLEGQTEIIRQKFRYEYDKKRNEEKTEFIKRKAEDDLKHQRKIFYLVLTFTAIIIIGLFIYRRNINEKNRQLNEIRILKSDSAVKNAMLLSVDVKPRLDVDKINEYSDNKLNQTDWNILNELFENPAISNKALAEKICLSVEGTRSSLRKMYRLFDINTSKNQRFELITFTIKLSTIKNDE